MKKHIKYSAAAILVIAISAMNVTAFAENAPAIISNNSAAITDVIKTELNYTILTGSIKAITTNDDGNIKIEFTSTEQGNIILNESNSDCLVLDGTKVTGLDSLKEGMEIKVVMDNDAPMALSYPGQTSGAVAIIANSEKTAVIDKLDDNLAGSTVAIKIGENTKIVDIQDAKQLITEDDVKDHECLVIFGIATKSIPAQTTPDLVVILDNAKKDTDSEEISKIALRKTFEDRGYEVEWISNDKPITITNGTVTAKITIGKLSVTIGDEIKELSSAVEIVDGVTYVPSDIVNLF